MSRGKSYEGEEFRLSWTITLEVPDKQRQAKGKGCKGVPPTKTILSNIGASRVCVRVRTAGGWVVCEHGLEPTHDMTAPLSLSPLGWQSARRRRASCWR